MHSTVSSLATDNLQATTIVIKEIGILNIFFTVPFVEVYIFDFLLSMGEGKLPQDVKRAITFVMFKLKIPCAFFSLVSNQNALCN